MKSADQTLKRDQSPSRHAALADTTIGIRRTSVGRERGLPGATPRSPGARLSKEELQSAREYLARPEAQQYLRARELLHTRTAQPRTPVAIEPRHVATVFRELAGARGSRSVTTPATTMHAPSGTGRPSGAGCGNARPPSVRRSQPLPGRRSADFTPGIARCWAAANVGSTR